MFALPLVIAQDLVAQRRQSYEATASSRRFRRASRRVADDAAPLPTPHRPAVRIVPRPADSTETSVPKVA